MNNNTYQIVVPNLGESVTQATISEIFKKTGDFVVKEEVIAVLETDKVNMEIFATSSGKISNLEIQLGTKVEAGQVIGSILQSSPDHNDQQNIQNETHSKNIAYNDDAIEKPKNSPAADKIIEEQNIDQSKIFGTGKNGRIKKTDVVQSALQDNNLQKNLGETSRQETVKEMSNIRQTIAKRLWESQRSNVTLTTFNEIDMSELAILRKKHQEEFIKKYNIKIGFVSFFVSATCCALLKFPIINSYLQNEKIISHNYCDIGVAIGTNKGLVVPILRNAEKMSIAEIEGKISEYKNKANTGELSIKEISGGTFTISNGGTYGSLMSTPIINPPQSAILGIHKISDRPVVKQNKEISISSMMYVALSYDHRIIDGKDAIEFLVCIKKYIEDPSRLLLGL